MSDTTLDPVGFYQFDLAQGTVRLQKGQRVLALSEDVLASLIVTAVSHGDLTAVRSLGTQLGEMVADGLAGAVSKLPSAAVMGRAANLLALFGWGRLNLERWGDALVLEMTDMPPLDDDNLAVAALLGGLFSTLCGVEVACVPLADAGKYIMVDPAIAEQVWTWSRDGETLPAIAARLVVEESAS